MDAVLIDSRDVQVSSHREGEGENGSDVRRLALLLPLLLLLLLLSPLIPLSSCCRRRG